LVIYNIILILLYNYFNKVNSSKKIRDPIKVKLKSNYTPIYLKIMNPFYITKNKSNMVLTVYNIKTDFFKLILFKR